MAMYATILLTIPDEAGFTYRIPARLTTLVVPGIQVTVPFGKRFVSGIVLELTRKLPPQLSPQSIREIQDIVSSIPVVSPELMKLLRWIADYYLCHLGEAYRLIHAQLNVGKSQLLFRRTEKTRRSGLTSPQRQVLELFTLQPEITLKILQKKWPDKSLPAVLAQLEKKGLLDRDYSAIQKKTVFRSEDFYRQISRTVLSDGTRERYQSILEGRPTRARRLLEMLDADQWKSATELRALGFTRQIAEKLAGEKLLEKKTEIKERDFFQGYHEEIPEISLTPEQQEIIQQIEIPLQESRFAAFLLHGITGSGKTQVYIELLKRMIQQKKQAIVLIPEIILTPQTLGRFRHHFGGGVAVIHSRLSAGEKREILARARQGQYSVILGPRSAIFAPLPRIGLIIVDEEHESSYKQSEARPHYHARDVAVYRAMLNQAVVVLGSATPSFESLYNVQQNTYRYFRLGKRIASRALPRISVIDLREEWKKSGEFPVLSEILELKIESRLLIREQMMILQNRRGYSPYILCQDCGYIAKCPHCDITLTYHRANRKLVCHYCNHLISAPDICPSCHGTEILYRGIGTQRLEEVISEKFPGTRMMRMDQDTTRGKHAHMGLLEKFRRGEADILLGTKMIAKGLDFQRVTLVGVISADQGLHFPDFRASEKVFQLLTQAAGRAGRGSSSGEVVIQTFDPSHFIFRYLFTHDYLAFFEKEMASRKTLKYPPFSRLILLRLEGSDESLLRGYGEAIVQFLWKANVKKSYTVLGPAPSPIYRIRDTYRYQILVKQDKEKDAALSQVRHIIKEGLFVKNDIRKWPVKVFIDVDPIEIL